MWIKQKTPTFNTVNLNRKNPTILNIEKRNLLKDSANSWFVSKAYKMKLSLQYPPQSLPNVSQILQNIISYSLLQMFLACDLAKTMAICI